MPTTDPRVSVFRSIPAVLGEGVMWHPARNSLFWLDITGRKVFETLPGREETRSLQLDQMVTAVAPTDDGKLVAALHRGIYLLDPDTGTVAEYARPTSFDHQHLRFNDGKCDPAGRFWAGTMGLNNEREVGCLYRIDAKRSISVMRERITCSNGLAWSADAKTLYYIDSPTRCVQAFDFEVATGVLSNHRVAIAFTESDGLPDGCTIDAEDRLWVAPLGRIESHLLGPRASPTARHSASSRQPGDQLRLRRTEFRYAVHHHRCDRPERGAEKSGTGGGLSVQRQNGDARAGGARFRAPLSRNDAEDFAHEIHEGHEIRALELIINSV